jgi:hypothetical protein
MSEISGKEGETVVESSDVREVKDSKDEEKVEADQLILNSSLYVRASEFWREPFWLLKMEMEKYFGLSWRKISILL